MCMKTRRRPVYTSMKAFYTLFIAACALGLSVATLKAETSQPTPPQTVESYFNQLETYKATFTQVNPDGSRQSGTFYLNRPRKFLWQYNNPLPHKLISTGGRMFFIDGDGGQVTHILLNSGLSAVLTQETFNLDNFKMIDNLQNDAEIGVTLSLPEADELAQGNVRLVLARDPLRLKALTTISPLGETTRVTFSQVQQNIPLDNDLFEYTPPHEQDYLLN